jgi:hypothetical protein
MKLGSFGHPGGEMNLTLVLRALKISRQRSASKTQASVKIMHLKAYRKPAGCRVSHRSSKKYDEDANLVSELKWCADCAPFRDALDQHPSTVLAFGVHQPMID